jgi:hypothetical protein
VNAAQHAREALKAARDAEAARASVQRTSSPTAGMKPINHQAETTI